MTREEKIKIVIDKGFIYNPDNGKVYSRFNKELTTIKGKGYSAIVFKIDGKQTYIYSHQFAWYWVYNECVDCIDHINGIKTDNRIINLRSVTYQENHFNRTTAKGCYYSKKDKLWIASIKVDSKAIYLGCFKVEEDARNAYLEAKKKYHK